MPKDPPPPAVMTSSPSATHAMPDGADGADGATASDRTVARAATEQSANPVRVRAPGIGVSAWLVPLALDSDGRLIAPKRYDVAGWNKAGPEPGETGTAVIAGHVDSHVGPAVFFRLRDLGRGDRVYVDRADGSTVTFTVYRVGRYLQSRMPDEVYRPASGPELRLITCGGTFDASRGDYSDNIVVYARR